MAAEGGKDVQFGIGQGMEAIEPDGVDAGRAIALDASGGVFQAAGAQPEAAILKHGVELSVDGQERAGQRQLKPWHRC